MKITIKTDKKNVLLPAKEIPFGHLCVCEDNSYYAIKTYDHLVLFFDEEVHVVDIDECQNDYYDLGSVDIFFTED